MKSGARVAVVGIATAALIAGVTVPANAGDNQHISLTGGGVHFTAYGEILHATDSRKDGYCITAELKLGGVTIGRVSACGDGKVVDDDLDIAEGKKVWLRGCYSTVGGSRNHWCSEWQGAIA
ncbi:hypothetical protein OHR68_29855 [Spirillospora sp. NBC_00431]